MDLAAWLTAKNVNFRYQNSSAGARTGWNKLRRLTELHAKLDCGQAKLLSQRLHSASASADLVAAPAKFSRRLQIFSCHRFATQKKVSRRSFWVKFEETTKRRRQRLFLSGIEILLLFKRRECVLYALERPRKIPREAEQLICPSINLSPELSPFTHKTTKASLCWHFMCVIRRVPSRFMETPLFARALEHQQRHHHQTRQTAQDARKKSFWSTLLASPTRQKKEITPDVVKLVHFSTRWK